MMKINLQFFGGRGSAGGKREESTNENASRSLGKIRDVLKRATSENTSNSTKNSNEFNMGAERARAMDAVRKLPTGSLVSLGGTQYRKDGRGENGFWRNMTTYAKLGTKGIGFSEVLLEQSNGIDRKKLRIERVGK